MLKGELLPKMSGGNQSKKGEILHIRYR